MSGYIQLTRDIRYQIYAFLKAGFSQTRIARQVGGASQPSAESFPAIRGKEGIGQNRRTIWPLTAEKRALNSLK